MAQLFFLMIMSLYRQRLEISSVTTLELVVSVDLLTHANASTAWLHFIVYLCQFLDQYNFLLYPHKEKVKNISHQGRFQRGPYSIRMMSLENEIRAVYVEADNHVNPRKSLAISQD